MSIPSSVEDIRRHLHAANSTLDSLLQDPVLSAQVADMYMQHYAEGMTGPAADTTSDSDSHSDSMYDDKTSQCSMSSTSVPQRARPESLPRSSKHNSPHPAKAEAANTEMDTEGTAVSAGSVTPNEDNSDAAPNVNSTYVSGPSPESLSTPISASTKNPSRSPAAPVSASTNTSKRSHKDYEKNDKEKGKKGKKERKMRSNMRFNFS